MDCWSLPTWSTSLGSPTTPSRSCSLKPATRARLARIPIIGPLLVDVKYHRSLERFEDEDRPPGPVERMKAEQAARRAKEAHQGVWEIPWKEWDGCWDESLDPPARLPDPKFEVCEKHGCLPELDSGGPSPFWYCPKCRDEGKGTPLDRFESFVRSTGPALVRSPSDLVADAMAQAIHEEAVARSIEAVKRRVIQGVGPAYYEAEGGTGSYRPDKCRFYSGPPPERHRNTPAWPPGEEPDCESTYE